MNKLISISELSRILDFIDPVTKTSNHVVDIGRKNLKKLGLKK